MDRTDKPVEVIVIDNLVDVSKMAKTFIQNIPIGSKVITPNYPDIGSRTGTVVGVAAENIIRAYIVELNEPFFDKRYNAYCKCYSYNSTELRITK